MNSSAEVGIRIGQAADKALQIAVWFLAAEVEKDASARDYLAAQIAFMAATCEI